MVEPYRGGELPQGDEDRLGTRGRVALAVFFLAAGYFLWTEHRAHVVQFLPWGILALCPLMHVFMHRGHGGHGAQDSDAGDEPGGRGR